MRRYSFIAIAGVAIAVALFAGVQSATALSFIIPNGALIDDIDFSGNPVASFDIDSPNKLYISIDASVIRLVGGGEIPLGGTGEGSLTMRMDLDLLASGSDGSAILLASFDGSTPHIRMLDGAGLDVVFEADSSRARSPSSGVAGTSPSAPGSATTSTSRSAGVGTGALGRTGIWSSSSFSADCGTVRAGASSRGGSSTDCSS